MSANIGVKRHEETIIIRDMRFYRWILEGGRHKPRANVLASAMPGRKRAVVSREPGVLFGCAVEQVRVELELCIHNLNTGGQSYAQETILNKQRPLSFSETTLI